MKVCNLAPRSSSLIESLRDIGYVFEVAVADIIDNSITAKSNKISLLSEWNDGNPYFSVIDNGIGMTVQDLLEAMRFGSKNPLELRAEDDLGRFGLGLKTSSFSQCKKTTVITKKNNETCGAIWDLNVINQSQTDWPLSLLDYDDILNDHTYRQLYDKYLSDEVSGTIVVWQDIDRIFDNATPDYKTFNSVISKTIDHLSLVFHRYLKPSLKNKGKKVDISINNNIIEAIDPFFESNNFTQELSKDEFYYKNQKISIQPYILPHHSKVSNQDWNKYALGSSYLSTQGFYIYRNLRLIIYGTWFRIIPKKDNTKLIRIKVDIPNTNDQDWKIDVKKSQASPPKIIRESFRRTIEEISYRGKKVYEHRGRKLRSNSSFPFWEKKVLDNKTYYGINREHPIIKKLLDEISVVLKDDLKRVFSFLEEMIPVEEIYNDYSESPDSYATYEIGEQEMKNLVELYIDKLNINKGEESDLIEIEPFSRNKELFTKIINGLL